MADDNQKKILITEKDEALSYLLDTICKIKGYIPRILQEGEDIISVCEEIKPNLVIIDYGSEETKDGINCAKNIKALGLNGVKIIFSSSVYNKKEILSAGADLYLPKPYDIDTLTNWIKKFLED